LIAAGVLEIGDGYRAKNDELAPTGIPFARAQNLNNGFDFTGADLYPLSAIDRVGTKTSRTGDCVFTSKGSVGRVGYVSVDTRPFVYSPQLSYWRSLNHDAIHPQYLRYWLLGPEFGVQRDAVKGSTDMADYVNLRDQRRMTITLPPLPTQRKIAAILSAYDGLIENNNCRIKLLEEMSQRVYREWFVDFRYPGRENVALVDSELGPIPDGWSVKSVREIASDDRYAVTSGPFGSQLGRKDYVESGVPVIRGVNLAVGGAFTDTAFVFVSNEKADAMPSCQAHPGDILITQRGTLGQVGLIPLSARFDRYVISQSQMKVTVDREKGSNQYLYAAMRSPEVSARLQGRAMTAGVPHINLYILREFRLVWPSPELQHRMTAFVEGMGRQVDTLTLTTETARATREFLLPRLLAGSIDVANLEIDVRELAA
jgi:type I restriction enzyme S subunit